MTAITDPDTLTRLAETCRRTCLHRVCTGKGDRQRWAHACKLAPVVELDQGDCAIDGCQLPAVALLPAGRRCDDHRPAQPTLGYCAPDRCYCATDSCQRPAPVSAAAAPSYGDATTDPLGRDGDGWHVGKQSRLPVRDKGGEL